jgi:hypothetical protein
VFSQPKAVRCEGYKTQLSREVCAVSRGESMVWLEREGLSWAVLYVLGFAVFRAAFNFYDMLTTQGDLGLKGIMSNSHEI